MWEPVIDLLLERGWTIRQMPCPELAFGGVRRFWWVRDQADTPRVPGALPPPCTDGRGDDATTRPQGDDVVLIGDRLEPDDGHRLPARVRRHGAASRTSATPRRAMVPGEGIFLEELAAELGERGLPHAPPDRHPALVPGLRPRGGARPDRSRCSRRGSTRERRSALGEGRSRRGRALRDEPARSQAGGLRRHAATSPRSRRRRHGRMAAADGGAGRGIRPQRLSARPRGRRLVGRPPRRGARPAR